MAARSGLTQSKSQSNTQGDRADELFYILSGKALVAIVTKCGKEALIAVPVPGQFFGEDCVGGDALRSSTVKTATACEVAVLRTNEGLKAFSNDLDFTRLFVEFLMEQNKQLKTALVEQMLLQSRAAGAAAAAADTV